MPQLTTLLKSNHLELSRRVRRAHSTFLKRTMGIDMLAQLAQAQHHYFSAEGKTGWVDVWARWRDVCARSSRMGEVTYGYTS